MTNSEAWSESSAIDYYARRRHEVADLYPSEKVFLPRVLFPGAKVLDVGCASGGFYNIMRSLEPSIEYTGIDIAEPAIALAKEKYPEATFQVTGGLEIPFDDNSFDLVHCTSVLVVEPRYQEVIGEMYRVSNRFVIVDMRLLKDIGDSQDFERSYYRIQFDAGVEQAKVPYVVSDADEVVSYVLGLDPKPKALRGTGYFHEVTPMANTTFDTVCMTIFLIQKGDPGTIDTELELQDLPLEFAIKPR
jgi:ubiquinone/menaquinone biosynthesis C-methylase UbiE